MSSQRRHWTATAAQQVAIYVSLRAEPPTQSAVARAVGDSGLNGDLRGVQGKSGVMIHFDANLFAEAAKRPDRRLPPLSPALMKKLIHGSIKGRGGLANKKVAEDHFDRPIDGDFIFLNDAGRNVLESLLAPFKSKDGKGALAHYLEHTEITLCLSQDDDVRFKIRLCTYKFVKFESFGLRFHRFYLSFNPVEESMEGKKKLNRGMINQIQRWHVISTEPMSTWLPERKHTKFPGSNRGNCIGWIGLGSASDEWTLTVTNKQPDSNLIVPLNSSMFGGLNHMRRPICQERDVRRQDDGRRFCRGPKGE